MFTNILTLLGIFLPVITWVMGLFKVSKEKQEAFIAKIQSAKDDGQIGIQSRDEFKKQDEELKNDPKRTD